MRCLAVFALLAGCSGLDYAQFPDAITNARCDYFVRCGVVASSTECRAYYDRISIASPSTQPAIDMNKVVYHADIAQQCLDAFSALSCDASKQTGHELDVCNGALTGTLAMDETCAFDKECDSGFCF